jgi:hypothetical protein
MFWSELTHLWRASVHVAEDVVIVGLWSHLLQYTVFIKVKNCGHLDMVPLA